MVSAKQNEHPGPGFSCKCCSCATFYVRDLRGQSFIAGGENSLWTKEMLDEWYDYADSITFVSANTSQTISFPQECKYKSLSEFTNIGQIAVGDDSIRILGYTNSIPQKVIIGADEGETFYGQVNMSETSNSWGPLFANFKLTYRQNYLSNLSNVPRGDSTINYSVSNAILNMPYRSYEPYLYEASTYTQFSTQGPKNTFIFYLISQRSFANGKNGASPIWENVTDVSVAWRSTPRET